MRYLVLGSNSFSGGSFIAYLLEHEIESEVFAVSRSKEYEKALLTYKNHPKAANVTFYQYDLNRDLEQILLLIEEYKIEYIVNFAAQGMVAQSWENPAQWIETNTLSLTKLLSKIYKFPFIQRFVQASTPEVYGASLDIKESMCMAPSSPYAASKAAADMMLYSYFKTHAFPVCFTRSANVYGRYQQLYRIIPKTIMMIHKSEQLELHGGGLATRSFIHIDDVSHATLKILKEGKNGEIYHISSTKSITICNLVDVICQEMGVSFEKSVKVGIPRASEDTIYLMNADKLENELSVTPQVSLLDGIRDVIEWIERDFEILKEFPDFYIHKH
ncbi:MAG: GDP-mannose 4,6-dehydratase [Sulfurimonas sp.]|nr:GDP-mannose 4,6-dehydratase [Sulfurimonas sp.]